MLYPEPLLPKANYRFFQFDNLQSNLYLVHYTDSKDNRDENGDLKAECVALQMDHLRDYSNNLLGEFEPEDCRLNLIKTGPRYEELYDLWQEGNDVVAPVYEIDFGLSINRGWFFLKVEDFHKIEFGVLSNEIKELPICKVLHTPTNSNFWHCSLRWIHENTDTSTVRGKKYILKLARSFIIENAIFNEPAYQALPPDKYQTEV